MPQQRLDHLFDAFLGAGEAIFWDHLQDDPERPKNQLSLASSLPGICFAFVPSLFLWPYCRLLFSAIRRISLILPPSPSRNKGAKKPKRSGQTHERCRSVSPGSDRPKIVGIYGLWPLCAFVVEEEEEQEEEEA